MRKRLRLTMAVRVCITLAMLLLVSAASQAAIPRYSTSPDDFVSARLQHFWVNRQPLRFTGYNVRGMVHYGGGDILPWATTGHRDQNLDYMQSVGARVARVFLSCKFADRYTTGDRLDAALQAAASRNIYLIVSFTDLYNSGFCPAGDEGYYNYGSWNLLNEQWFASGYQVNYLPQVQYIVNRFKSDPTVFAWQIGNELKCPWDWADILPFSHDVAEEIRAIDQNHMVSHGTAGRNFMGLTWDQAVQLYQDFDFLTIHPYNGDENLNDSSLADALGKPLLVSEAGMSSDLYDYIQRPAATDADISKWINRGARGYMNWGLMATDYDMGDGDFLFGIDRVLTWKDHHLDFNAYTQVFANWSQILANTTPPAPETPTGLQATDGVWPDRVVVTWNESFPADEYAVFRADADSSGGGGGTPVNLLPDCFAYQECGHYNQDCTGEHIYDGSLLTKWCCLHNGTNTPGDHWLIFDLGRQCTINSYVVKHASMGGEPTYLNTKTFYIESGPSMSGPWTTEFYVNNSTTVASNTLQYTMPKSLRYIRLRVTRPNPSADWAVRIPEFEVWGIPDGDAPVQVSPWQTETSFADMTAEPGKTYTYWVKARNSGGVSPVSASDDGFANAVPMMTVSEAKQLENNAPVFIANAVVSAVFQDNFYIQQPDRSSGLRCPGTTPVQPGQTALFRGRMGTYDGHRILTTALAVEGSVSESEIPSPMAMPNRSIGGGPTASETGVLQGFGLNNVGLLISTWGRVTAVGADHLYVDDGSGLRDGTYTGDDENIGVRVICDPTGCTIGDYLAITGISSCFRTPTSQIARCIVPPGAPEITKL